MLCGCPVLAYDNGAMRETVGTGGQGGRLVGDYAEFAQAVKEIAQASKGLPNLAREQCRHHAEQFSIGSMVGGYEKLCREAAATGGW